MSLALVIPADKQRDLRRELADCIANRNAAEGRARIAKDTFDRAEHARCEAADHVARLKADLDAIRRAATERAAKGFTDALRAGSPLPLISTPASDNAALAAATDRLDALAMAASTLAVEVNRTADAAALAASTVNALATSIMEADARALAANILEAFNEYWRLRDRLAGYTRIEPTRLADIGDEIARGLNRQNRLAAKDARFLESYHWMDFLDRIATSSERKWRDYGQRLANDASARFEESSQ